MTDPGTKKVNAPFAPDVPEVRNVFPLVTVMP
jgi:hypothetical protein